MNTGTGVDLRLPLDEVEARLELLRGGAAVVQRGQPQLLDAAPVPCTYACT